jgi:hypothetical protein
MTDREKYVETLEQVISNACTMIFFMQGLSRLVSNLLRQQESVGAEADETVAGVLGMLAWQMEKTLSKLVRNGFRPQNQD